MNPNFPDGLLASMTLLLILAAFLSILVNLSAANQRSFMYPIDGQIYFP